MSIVCQYQLAVDEIFMFCSCQQFGVGNLATLGSPIRRNINHLSMMCQLEINNLSTHESTSYTCRCSFTCVDKREHWVKLNILSIFSQQSLNLFSTSMFPERLINHLSTKSHQYFLNKLSRQCLSPCPKKEIERTLMEDWEIVDIDQTLGGYWCW